MSDPHVSLTASVVSPFALTAAEVAFWERLCATVDSLNSPFLSHHFTRAVAEVRPDVYICVIRRKGEPVGFLPFQFRTRLHKLLRVAEPVGECMTGYFGLVAAPGLCLDPQLLLRLCQVHY